MEMTVKQPKVNALSMLQQDRARRLNHGTTSLDAGSKNLHSRNNLAEDGHGDNEFICC